MRAGLLVLVLASPALAQNRPAGWAPVPDALPLYMPGARGLPRTSAAAELGRALFFDTRLSRDGRIACATCHDPARAFTDGRRISVGVGGITGARNAPTLVNRAYGESQFWDGRVETLLEQVLHPIEDPREMGIAREEAARRVASDASYVAAFAEERLPIDADGLARVLGAYVASILSAAAPFDRAAAGDTLSLSADARLGRRLFDGKAGCIVCHRGPNFTDEGFHNTGAAYRAGVWTDSGRFVVTRKPADLGAFKTPTLREVARTAPYMHDGSIATLEAVIEFYDRGGITNPGLDRELRTLHLTALEKRALIAFLHSLSGTVREGGWGVSPLGRARFAGRVAATSLGLRAKLCGKHLWARGAAESVRRSTDSRVARPGRGRRRRLAQHSILVVVSVS